VGVQSLAEGAGGDGCVLRFKRVFAGADEYDDQRELDGEDEVVHDLCCDDVEAEDECRKQAGQGTDAEDRVDTERGPDGDRPGEPSRGGADAQQVEQRLDGAGPQPAAQRVPEDDRVRLDEFGDHRVNIWVRI